MKLTVTGKQMDIGDSLRAYIKDKIEDISDKYFNRAIESIVTLRPEGGAFVHTHISIRIGKDIMVMADAQTTDAYASFDEAAEKVAKQLRRYKKKLRDHHERLEDVPATEHFDARDVVLQADTSEDEQDDHQEPIVIAEMTTNIQSMSVSEAVMRLDLSGHPALMFRNAQHGGINMVYRRGDGNVGWVDPEDVETLRKNRKKSA